MPLNAAEQIRKMPTGIAQLDDVLRGGIPEGRTTLIGGGPGSGKSVLGVQILYNQASTGRAGIFIAFEERADGVIQNAATMGLDLRRLDQDGLLTLIDARIDPQTIVAGDFDLDALLSIVEGVRRQTGASLIVLDSLDALLRVFNNTAKERDRLLYLHDWLADRGLTSIITAKRFGGAETQLRYDFLDFLTDCVIDLAPRASQHWSARCLTVVKYRGSGYGGNEYPFLIGAGGVRLLPVGAQVPKTEPLGDFVTSGIARLDQMLGGGFRSGASVIVAGASGTGKTTLASTFTASACTRGETVLYISFEESERSLVGAMKSAGIDLQSVIEQGTLKLLALEPDFAGPEEHLMRIVEALESSEPRHMVVDPVSALTRINWPDGPADLFARLISYSKSRGIINLLLSQASGSESELNLAGAQISSLVDSIVFLRYAISAGELNRVACVIKSRGTAHSNQIRELFITSKGIDIAESETVAGGGLTGMARLDREAQSAADRLRLMNEIQGKARELQRRRAEMQFESERLSAEIEEAQAQLNALEKNLAQIDSDRARRGGRREGA